MRACFAAVSYLCFAACCGLSAPSQAAIQVTKTNGQAVPDGTYTMNLNFKTGGWDITLLSLYAPGLETVYEIRCDGGEIIDNIFIAVDGPAAGSPVIVRAYGLPPQGLLAVNNVIQLGNAETIINKIDVIQDIGFVQAQVIGQLFAGRDILGPVIATTPNNPARGITDMIAQRHILGDVLAENGRIGLVYAYGNIGTAGDPVDIRARHRVMQVSGVDVHANINTRFNGGTGGMFALVADKFFGALETEQLIFNSANQLDGRIYVGTQFEGEIRIGKSFNNLAQYIEMPRPPIAGGLGLTGQIIINADGVPGGTWTAPVRLGPNGHPQQITLTGPVYAQTAAQLGGGAVGLVPFRLQHASCTPPSGQAIQIAPPPFGSPLQVDLRHFGPVTWNAKAGPPALIDRRPAGTTGPFAPVPIEDFQFMSPENDRNVLRIAAAPGLVGGAGFAPGYQYRIRPAAALKCDVTSLPPVLWEADYFVTVTLPPCDGDVNGDALVNVNDLLLVIAFWGPAQPIFPAADINDDGFVNVNDLLMVINAWGACW